MDDFITIATFVFPSELVVAKSKLESEGIECRVLDELTVQSYNFLSNAVGGVKLQVQKSDFRKALNILQTGGFIAEEKPHELNYLERKFSNPAFYRKVKNSLIILSSIILLAVIVLFINLYINKPSDYERLIGERWCLDHVVYDNEIFVPNTSLEKLQIYISGVCIESIIFDSTGVVQFPGFGSPAFQHRWVMANDQIIISNMDTLINCSADANDAEAFCVPYLLAKNAYA
jgi:hypothetical protein